MAGAPKVISTESDITASVPSFPGVYGVITVAAQKGEVGVPSLITSEAQYLSRYAIGGTIGVAEDMAHYSALNFLVRSNKLWVIRVANNPLYGILPVPAAAPAGATRDNKGLADPRQFPFSGGEPFLISGLNPGAWNNEIKVGIEAYTVEPNSFQLVVYWRGEEVERHCVSRVRGQKDGYNRSMYIIDVLMVSQYIKVEDNLAVSETTVIAARDPTALSGGSVGSAVTDAERITALESMKNTNSYPLTLMMDGGNTTAGYQKALISVCETRGDCIAVLSTPYFKEIMPDTSTEVVNYRTTDLNSNTSYACLYSPHCLIYDKFNDRDMWVSPDGFVAGVISNNSLNNELWDAPAGFRRGVLDSAVDTLVRYTDGELDILYDNQINPIRFAPGRGIVIWGQKTLLSRPSKLDRINVRLLMIYIRPAIAESLESYEFEVNDFANRSLVTAMIESYMDGIKGRNGVSDYYVICNEDNNTADDIDQNRMNVDLFVKPMGVAEYINFRTIITPTGMSFTDAALAA